MIEGSKGRRGLRSAECPVFSSTGSLLLGFWTYPFSPNVCCLVAKLCPTLYNPMGCSLPRSSVHGLSQARIPEWVAISFSGDLPDPGIKPTSPALQADSYYWSHPGSPLVKNKHSKYRHYYLTYSSDGSAAFSNDFLSASPIWEMLELQGNWVYPRPLQGFSP